MCGRKSAGARRRTGPNVSGAHRDACPSRAAPGTWISHATTWLLRAGTAKPPHRGGRGGEMHPISPIRGSFGHRQAAACRHARRVSDSRISNPAPFIRPQGLVALEASAKFSWAVTVRRGIADSVASYVCKPTSAGDAVNARWFVVTSSIYTACHSCGHRMRANITICTLMTYTLVRRRRRTDSP